MGFGLGFGLGIGFGFGLGLGCGSRLGGQRRRAMRVPHVRRARQHAAVSRQLARRLD